MEIQQVFEWVGALVGGGLAGWGTAKAHVTKLLTKTYAGRLEEMLEQNRSEAKLRETTVVHVVGEGLLPKLKQQGFRASRVAEPNELPRLGGEAVVVVDGDVHHDLSRCSASWLLVFCRGRFEGQLPPGIEVIYANSLITLDARLMELLRAKAAHDRHRG
jgi:hypothetical protein